MDFKSILLAQKTGYIPRNHFDALFAKRIGGAVLKDFPGLPASIVTVTDALAKPLGSLKVAITPVQSGSGDPSPENVRPISGWTECNIWRIGKNLLPITKWFSEGYTYTSSGTTVTFLDEGKIKVSGTNAFSGNTDIYLSRAATNYNSLYVKNGNYTISCEGLVDGISIVTSGSGNNVFPYTLLSRNNSSKTGNVTNEAKPFSYFIIRVSGNATVNATINLQLEKGNTATAYEPYTGTTYPITFPSEAGTVYGGTLDVTNGTLTVTKANIASYDGETLPGVWISDRDVYVEGTTPTTGAQVVYDLDTPITYHLTPTEIQMLLGTNNIWANTGDILEGKYYAKR